MIGCSVHPIGMASWLETLIGLGPQTLTFLSLLAWFWCCQFFKNYEHPPNSHCVAAYSGVFCSGLPKMVAILKASCGSLSQLPHVFFLFWLSGKGQRLHLRLLPTPTPCLKTHVWKHIWICSRWSSHGWRLPTDAWTCRTQQWPFWCHCTARQASSVKAGKATFKSLFIYVASSFSLKK